MERELKTNIMTYYQVSDTLFTCSIYIFVTDSDRGRFWSFRLDILYFTIANRRNYGWS